MKLQKVKKVLAMTPQQIKAVQALGTIILEAVSEDGAPNGPIYAAMMGMISLSQYQQIIDTLKRAGALTESGHYFQRGPKYDQVLNGLKRSSSASVLAKPELLKSADTEYQQYFQKKLKEFGVKSPAQFPSEDHKKDFFNDVKKGWSGTTKTLSHLKKVLAKPRGVIFDLNGDGMVNVKPEKAGKGLDGKWWRFEMTMPSFQGYLKNSGVVLKQEDGESFIVDDEDGYKYGIVRLYQD